MSLTPQCSRGEISILGARKLLAQLAFLVNCWTGLSSKSLILEERSPLLMVRRSQKLSASLRSLGVASRGPGAQLVWQFPFLVANGADLSSMHLFERRNRHCLRRVIPKSPPRRIGIASFIFGEGRSVFVNKIILIEEEIATGISA